MRSMIKIAAGLALLSGTAIAGTWVEVGDAADVLSGFQVTNGVGSLDSISGATSTSGGDWVDAYCIKVTDPSAFFASVNATFPGAAGASTAFDSRIFLFSITGQPLMMNDDWPATASPFPSAIAGPALYTSTGEITVDAPQEVVAGQDYILAIAGFSNNIENAANQDLFRVDSLVDYDALYGPDPAVAGPADHWENGASDASGIYHIALGGVTYSVPAPGALTLLGAGGLVALRRRR